MVGLLERHNVQILSQIWVKALGAPFDPAAVYTFSIQSLYTAFNKFLTQKNSFFGFCVADSRDHLKKISVAHSVFSQKFSSTTPNYGRSS